jgi:transcriptional regulator with XRE-family HTH domain
MIDIEELSKRIIYYRALNKISLKETAKRFNVSVNTLQKMIKKQNVKEITRIYAWEKLEILENGGN